MAYTAAKSEAGTVIPTVGYQGKCWHARCWPGSATRTRRYSYQEYGTSKMAPRPNLEMAIEQSDGTINNVLEQPIRRALGGD